MISCNFGDFKIHRHVHGRDIENSACLDLIFPLLCWIRACASGIRDSFVNIFYCWRNSLFLWKVLHCIGRQLRGSGGPNARHRVALLSDSHRCCWQSATSFASWCSWTPAAPDWVCVTVYLMCISSSELAFCCHILHCRGWFVPTPLHEADTMVSPGQVSSTCWARSALPLPTVRCHCSLSTPWPFWLLTPGAWT